MQDVLAKVQRAFGAAFDIEPGSITLETLPGDIKAWDSMGHITLASSLEREFNVSLDVDDLMAMESVREIVRILESKLGPGV